jgi:transcriptional regulator GlxA family with amidase domain
MALRSGVMQRAPRRIAILTYPGGQTLDVTGPYEVFSAANVWLRLRRGEARPAYALEILAPVRGPVRMSSGLSLVADRAWGAVRGRLDTLLVAGGDARAAAAEARLLAWLRAMRPRTRRLASVCTGAFVLAAAGLLDGRRATTHWAAAAELARQHPRVEVDPDAIFVHDGTVWTSAGVTAGMDLALALVEEDLGREAALTVARHLVLFLKRPGGQSQFSTHLAAQTLPRGPLKDLPEWIVEHLEGDLSVEALASRAAMSPRNFARVFVRETGATPAKFVERARVERARRLLEEGATSVEEVASECGFGSAERMRRTFRRHLRVVPLDYRRRFEVGAPASAPRRAMGGKR